VNSLFLFRLVIDVIVCSVLSVNLNLSFMIVFSFEVSQLLTNQKRAFKLLIKLSFLGVLCLFFGNFMIYSFN